jgi:hypothetical protein
MALEKMPRVGLGAQTPLTSTVDKGSHSLWSVGAKASSARSHSLRNVAVNASSAHI